MAAANVSMLLYKRSTLAQSLAAGAANPPTSGSLHSWTRAPI